MSCVDILKNHTDLKTRRDNSDELLKKIQAKFSAIPNSCQFPLSVFSAGSLSRKEIGKYSDLDIFIVRNDNSSKFGKLDEYELFSNIICINRCLSLPAFSNDGEFLKIHNISDLIKYTGSRKDDNENWFTARMLFILESIPLLNIDLYKNYVANIVYNYYRDGKGTATFKPLFLLNDLLRYWRTLCINYEERRNDPTKPWRKKNINLRFSRMATVFGTILPLVAKPIDNPDEFISLTERTALERLAYGIDLLGNKNLEERWNTVLDKYALFLSWKEDEQMEKHFKEAENQDLIKQTAEVLSSFLYDCLKDEHIEYEYRKYLVL
jgi:hypothetical protein